MLVVNILKQVNLRICLDQVDLEERIEKKEKLKYQKKLLKMKITHNYNKSQLNYQKRLRNKKNNKKSKNNKSNSI